MGYWLSPDLETRPDYSYIAGVDLGQSRDPSALIVAKMTVGTIDIDRGSGRQVRRTYFEGGATYDIGHIERLPLGTKYPAVVTHTRSVIAALQGERPKHDVALVVDRTGVGRAVGDLMTEETVGVAPVLVTITGGDAVTKADDGGYGVPKRELASVIQALLQTSRLRLAEDQPFLEELKSELAGFRAKIKLSGSVSFEAGEDWRSAAHDDLVLALALAVWAGENGLGMPFEWGTVDGRPLDQWFRDAGIGGN